MGFYLRKSVRVGPFRFNLSKSGVGVSAGIKGLRVGTGPRGNYVHMGRGGLYYRASLLSGSGPQPQTIPAARQVTAHSGFIEIESGSVTEMVDSSSAALLSEITEKRGKFPLWIAVLGLTVMVALLAGEAVGGLILIVGLALSLATSQVDAVRRTTVLLYDLDGAVAERYQTLVDVFTELAQCGRVGHIGAEGAVNNRKYHAGASTLIRRHAIRPGTSAPARVKTNIAVPSLPVGRQTLYFFPDRLLVFDNAGVGAVSYAALRLEVRESRFIENESVPTDAKVVGQTWRYLNKKGGPDRRFKDNRELPTALYDEIRFQSDTGLNEMIQVSRLGLGEKLKTALNKLSIASDRDGRLQETIFRGTEAIAGI